MNLHVECRFYTSCLMCKICIQHEDSSGLYFLIERMIRNKKKQSSEDVLQKILDILKNFGIFTNKVAGLWIFHNFSEQFFYRTSPVVASGNTTGFLFFCKHLSLTLLPLSLKAGYTLLQWYQFSIGNWCWLNSGLRISIKWAKVHRSRVNRYGTLLCKGLSELIKNPGIEDNDI